SKYDRHGWMQDAVDHTAMGFLGITLRCARCHDHTYDPFTQEEYFQFRALFEPYQVRMDRAPAQPDTQNDGLARHYDETPNAETTKPSPVAEKAVAAAKAALPALEARIKADKAKYLNSLDAEALSEAARKAERQAGILKAAENVLRAHLELEAAGTDEKKIG